MPEKKFVISPGKRIFSRVEQECETGVQGWNGTVPKAGQRRGARPSARGRTQERARQGRGKKEEAQGAEGGWNQGDACERRGREKSGPRDGIAAEKGEPRGRALPKEGLSTAARNERMRPVGPRREERTAGGTGGRRDAVRGSSGIVPARRRYAGAARGGIGPTAVPGGNIALEQESPRRGRRGLALSFSIGSLVRSRGQGRDS